MHAKTSQYKNRLLLRVHTFVIKIALAAKIVRVIAIALKE
jgi:hypothetical protein